MESERWQRIKEILADVETTTPDRQEARLREACGEDSGLIHDVESFLEFDELADEFIEEPLSTLDLDNLEAAMAPEPEEDDPNLDRRIGHYRIQGLVARGGMGAVYQAVREDDYEQKVALKLISKGQSTDGIIERFYKERQILANLQHPNIARLLDGGSTEEDWLPWLAMEYVDGEPVDVYCARHELGVRQRLELFRQVCSAVHFAHQNLVVHRDLKPSNILVTPDGVPKLLDFGIAKILEPDLVDVNVTIPGRGPMTPNYASPEQVRDEVITTASDIYSLGVLLYRLLAGRLPYVLEGCGYTKMVQVICEVEPRRPSATLGQEEPLESVLQGIQAPSSRTEGGPSESEAKKLRRQLVGDVDAIVLKALRKEPRHRYASALDFSQDVRRHLTGLPVAARKGTWLYLAGKYARRHTWGLLSAAAMLVLIVGFTIALALQLKQTETERDRAERARDAAERARDQTQQVVEFMVDVFDAANPNEGNLGTVTARELLDRGRERIGEELEDEPELRAQMLGTIGQAYQELGQLDDARELFDEELDLARRTFTEDHVRLASAYNDLGIVLYLQGSYTKSVESLQEALQMLRRLLGDQHPDVARTLTSLGNSLVEVGRHEEAEEAAREALDIRRSVLPAGDKRISNSLNGLGSLLFRQRKYAAAEPIFRETLAIRQEELGPSHPAVARALNNLGRVLFALGELAEAEALYRESLEIRREIFGEDSSPVATVERNLASLLAAKGDPGAGEKLARQALRKYPQGSWRVADAESILGACLTGLGRYQEAETFLVESYRELRQAKGDDDAYTREAGKRLVALYEAWGEPQRLADYPELAIPQK